MTSATETTGAEATMEQLPVGVELRSDLAERFGAESRDALLAYVTELVESVGIPAAPSVSVTSYESASEEDEPYRIRIGDRVCARTPAMHVEDGATPELTAEAIAGVIAANRELLLVPAVAEQLFREWSAESPLVARAALSPEAFHRVLVDLLGRCFSVAPRALAARDEGATEPCIDVPEQLVEAIIGASNAASVSVFVEPQLLASNPDDASAIRDYDLSTTGDMLLELLLDELGLLLPLVTFEAEAALDEGRFRIQINDVRFPPLRGLRAEELMVNGSVEDLAGREITARRATNPTHGGEASVITADEAAVAALTAAGYFIIRPRTYVAFATRREIRQLAGSLLLPDVLAFQLDQLRADDDVVVDAALRRFDRYLLTSVFRRLLDEEVPIRDAVGILEGMLAVGASVSVDQSVYDLVAPDAASLWIVPPGTELMAPGVDQYADCVRRHLRWQVSRAFVDEQNRLRAFTVDRRLESRIRQSSRPLDEDERAQLSRSVWSIYEPLARAGSVVVAVTNSEVRRELRRLLEKEFRALHVLSRHEIAPDTDIQTVGHIAWA